jgi:hypothetical protein
MKKTIISGTKSKKYFILGYKGKSSRGQYHRVPAKSLLEAKAKMLKGTRLHLSDVKKYKGKRR